MRGKRSKQYKKLMQHYSLSFGFREPYQVLVDADIIRDADRFKMDLIGGLERALHGKVKPMITQCSMRHLYASATDQGMSFVIEKAKMLERRRCDHLPSDYPVPLSAESCIKSVVDPKGTGNNKHRYIVASQDLDLRKALREVKGVPLIYINRSVMIMEPMAGITAENIAREEKLKLKAGVKRGSNILKRTRSNLDSGDESSKREIMSSVSKNMAKRGPKGPNPLSIKKPKVKIDIERATKTLIVDEKSPIPSEVKTALTHEPGSLSKKRKRKHKTGGTKEIIAITSSDV